MTEWTRFPYHRTSSRWATTAALLCLAIQAIGLGSPTVWASDDASRYRSHWAFQPIVRPVLPTVKNTRWAQTPIDTLVLARLEDSGLIPSPAADRRTLIRRASYTLTGLPPSPEEVARFVGDTAPSAYRRMVDRLLNSPHYGEQWARHWLDVARYSDTKGYVYAREERFWVHAWSYRDWVVRALNGDTPYNRFLLLQLAADQVDDASQADLAAMGFLTLGRRFLGVKRDIIDDRIDVVCRGTMGLTVGCARCHDHKYDAIPTADYYSLYGVFDSCAERLVALNDGTTDEAYEKEYRARQEKLRTTLAVSREETSDRVREHITDYLRAQTELHKYPADGFDQILQKTDLLPSFVWRWAAYLADANRREDPVFAPWHAYAELPTPSFAQRAVEVTQRLSERPRTEVNRIVANAFVASPASFDEVIDRYGSVFADVNGRWKSVLDRAAKTESKPPTELAERDAERLRHALYGPGSPCEVPDEPIVNTETFFDSETASQLWKLRGEVDRWIIKSDGTAPHALTLVDRSAPVRPRIFQRGNPLKLGDEVPRQFLRLISGDQRRPFQHGSGRRELADAIIDPANPLTARVIVNRIWSHHFGQGLVSTASDFGIRADPPSHGKLLDWLANRLVAEGWSLKNLHRLILLSATFQQSSTGPADLQTLARAQKVDPANRWLWRTNQHRLTFEEFRDSLLAASFELDRQIGGKPSDLFKQPITKRRTLYGLVDRQFLPGTLRMFDFANPDLHIPQRTETTVPQQALFFLNHPLVLERARVLAEHSASLVKVERVRFLFQRVYHRIPTDAELAEALDFVRTVSATDMSARPADVSDPENGHESLAKSAERTERSPPSPFRQLTAWEQLAQLLLCTNEFLFVD